MNANEVIMVRSRNTPVVEIDTAAGAAYIRFKRWDAKVARTQRVKAAGSPIVTIDFDRSNEVIGVELIGVKEFGLLKLLDQAQVRAPNVDMNRARYANHPVRNVRKRGRSVVCGWDRIFSKLRGHLAPITRQPR